MDKKFILAAALAATVSTQASAGKQEKVKIIHNGHVIEVAAAAVAAHLAHGDELYVEVPPPAPEPDPYDPYSPYYPPPPPPPPAPDPYDYTPPPPPDPYNPYY